MLLRFRRDKKNTHTHTQRERERFSNRTEAELYGSYTMPNSSKHTHTHTHSNTLSDFSLKYLHTHIRTLTHTLEIFSKAARTHQGVLVVWGDAPRTKGKAMLLWMQLQHGQPTVANTLV
eukprot:GHVR01121629.1.p1 GENE.GHVR01121629.1~~GHVR01121629.1.p1  ORF type:complete len:119 (+),score=53.70 GHVR01121629.1:769-1125(+)